MKLLYQKNICDTIVPKVVEQERENMYHISEDKRAKKSAELIGNGLLRCLENKDFADITVTDVQRAATVGRATFYRLFDNTADVLSYLCDGIFEQAGKEYQQLQKCSADTTTLTFIRIWMENKILLKAIVDNNRMDFIFRAHMKYLTPIKEEVFPGRELDEAQTIYLMTMLTACTSAFLTAWLINGAAESAEELQVRLKECFQTLGKIFD